MTMMIPEYQSAEVASWTHDDFVSALHQVDRTATWIKARMVATYATQYGDLGKLADSTGISYSTLRNWRSVWNAYKECTDIGTFSFGVADAFRKQDDRIDLLKSRDDWTTQSAREFVTARNNPPPPRPADADPDALEGTAVIPPEQADQEESESNQADEPSGKPEATSCDGKRQSPAPAIKSVEQYLTALLTYSLTDRERKRLENILKNALTELVKD